MSIIPRFLWKQLSYLVDSQFQIHDGAPQALSLVGTKGLRTGMRNLVHTS